MSTCTLRMYPLFPGMARRSATSALRAICALGEFSTAAAGGGSATGPASGVSASVAAASAAARRCCSDAGLALCMLRHTFCHSFIHLLGAKLCGQALNCIRGVAQVSPDLLAARASGVAAACCFLKVAAQMQSNVHAYSHAGGSAGSCAGSSQMVQGGRSDDCGLQTADRQPAVC